MTIAIIVLELCVTQNTTRTQPCEPYFFSKSNLIILVKIEFLQNEHMGAHLWVLINIPVQFHDHSYNGFVVTRDTKYHPFTTL